MQYTAAFLWTPQCSVDAFR